MAKQVLIIGGGASGLTAGIQAARNGADVTILEHMDRVGKKILSTGNGKCNMTNLELSFSCYRSDMPEFPMKVIEGFPVGQTLDFFRGLGILPKIKNGYVYPNSEQASAVSDVLRMEASRLGIQIVCGCQVKTVLFTKRKDGPTFQAVCTIDEKKAVFFGDALILAAGSMAAPSSGSDGSGYTLAKALGHTVIKPLPALVQLLCEGKEYKVLAGIRTEARICLFVDGHLAGEDRGELQLTDYGISGIPTFQVSRFASKALDQNRRVQAVIDFLPSMTEEELYDFLLERQTQSGYKTAEEFLTGALNKKLAGTFLKLAGIGAKKPVSQITKEERMGLGRLIHRFETTIIGTKGFSNAQVCCGGVDVREVSWTTMESRLVPGLYFAGEILDVDGICGGYNLQWAWSSGSLAGICAARDSKIPHGNHSRLNGRAKGTKSSDLKTESHHRKRADK